MIFFDIEKSHHKVNRDKTLEQLENMGLQGRILRFIRELIGERWITVRVGGSVSQSKQADLEILQGGVLNVTLFVVATNGILGELGNGVNGELVSLQMIWQYILEQEIREWQPELCRE